MQRRIHRDNRVSRLVIRVGKKRRDGARHSRRQGRGKPTEKAPRRVAELDREFILADIGERCGKRIDGIVWPGHGTVTAGISCLQTEIGDGLFSDLHRQDRARAIRANPPTAAFVERIFGIDQVAAILRQPACAVKGRDGFLSTRQRHLDRALRLEPLLLVPDQCIGPDRRLGLVVR